MPDCPFCEYDGPSPILRTFSNAFVIEPINPVVPGHVLVVASAHVTDFSEAPATTGVVMAAAARYAVEARLGDCNLITSRGAWATQTIAHLHVHLVPRRDGDGLRLPWSA